MTALLPARSADEVRAFTEAREPAAAAVHPLEAECAALRRELDEARAAIADVRRDSDRAVEAAREDGHREGLAQAEERQAERLTALEGALDAAVLSIDQKLIALDRLAAELASAALTRLLDDPAAAREMSASFIARQVRELKRVRLVRARISAQDFEDETSLAALGVRLREGGSEVEIVRDAVLQSGQAKLELALGQTDLDLTSQWRSLVALLRDMARD